ncbi:MAG: hypothetical protein ACO3FE_14215 [Planctomycetaceae bacterium]
MVDGAGGFAGLSDTEVCCFDLRVGFPPRSVLINGIHVEKREICVHHREEQSGLLEPFGFTDTLLKILR